MSFKEQIRIENSNLTSVVRNIKKFITYLDARKVVYLDWSIFSVNNEWAKAFEETQSQARLDM